MKVVGRCVVFEIDLAELDSKEGTGLETGVVVSWNAKSGEIWGPSTA